jgi:hypothetical protein
LVVSYDAAKTGPIAFISAHYGASLPTGDRPNAQFLIFDLDTCPVSHSLTSRIKLKPEELLEAAQSEKMKKLFPDLWKLTAEVPKTCKEVKNPAFLQAIAKAIGDKSFSFQDIFKVSKDSNDMQIIEIAKDATFELTMMDAFDMHVSIRAEDMTVHVAIRPWADRREGYASTNVGLPTSYFWFRLYFDSKTGTFRLAAKDGGGDPFGQSKLNALICWTWLEQQGEDVRAVFKRATEFLNDRVAWLNSKVKGINWKSIKQSPDGSK